MKSTTYFVYYNKITGKGQAYPLDDNTQLKKEHLDKLNKTIPEHLVCFLVNSLEHPNNNAIKRIARRYM